MKLNSIKLAILVPCFNEMDLIDSTTLRLINVLNSLIEKEKISKNSFILYVDDGSTDKTWSKIKKNIAHTNNIKGIKLSKNRGHQNALIAGMEYLKDTCDCLISIDADLQQDETLMEDFINKFSQGFDIVLGVRNDRSSDNFIKKSTALMFYKAMHIMGVDIVKNHADYRLLSNKANCALLEFKEINLFLRGILPLVGFKTDYIFFNVKNREIGESKYTFSKMISLALNGVTSFSVVPLRIISVLGLIVFILSLVMSIYIIGMKIFTDSVVPGWASTVLPLYLLGGLQVLSIGVVGEYIGKIYIEVKRRPRYIIEEVLD